MTKRYRHRNLIDATQALFSAVGLDTPLACTVAEILVEAELLGYDTHGLQFIPAYVKGIEEGVTARSGEPEVLRDGGNTLLIDARRLPGQWASVWTLDTALARLPEQGVVTVAIQRTENISCLATYAKRAADRGAMAIIASSSPGGGVVAPAGGKEGRLSTNPLALGIPADPHPILIDTSTASVSNRQIERRRRAGELLSGPHLIDASGVPSDDPEAFYGDPKGAIMPLGGTELGHKGFAFSLMVDAMTTSLAGTGRASDDAVGSNVFLQVIDPAAFGGEAAFRDEATALAETCRAAAPVNAASPVRVPGDRAYACWADRMENGVPLHPEVPGLYEPVFARYGIEPPQPMD